MCNNVRQNLRYSIINILRKLSKFFRCSLVHLFWAIFVWGGGGEGKREGMTPSARFFANAARAFLTYQLLLWRHSEYLWNQRFCAIHCNHCCFVALRPTKFTLESICKMSQLHQEALRRQHVVDKRNVNDLSWLVSMTAYAYAFAPNHKSLALFCKRASVDSNCTIPYLLFKNQLKLRKSLSVEKWMTF